MSKLNAKLHHPLTEAEFIELDRFLASRATGEHTMMVDTLDGFLTAMLVGPVDIPMARWLPKVWGQDNPSFRNREQADRILGLIVRQLNGISRSLELEIENFRPVLDVVEEDSTEYEDAEMWCFGFMAGINLARQDWQPLFESPETLESLKPIYLLGEKHLPAEQQANVASVQQRAVLAAQIPQTVATLYKFWQPQRDAAENAPNTSTVQYDSPKVGRNDDCPCGSGKKYKKCCGKD